MEEVNTPETTEVTVDPVVSSISDDSPSEVSEVVETDTTSEVSAVSEIVETDATSEVSAVTEIVETDVTLEVSDVSEVTEKSEISEETTVTESVSITETVEVAESTLTTEQPTQNHVASDSNDVKSDLDTDLNEVIESSHRKNVISRIRFHANASAPMTKAQSDETVEAFEAPSVMPNEQRTPTYNSGLSIGSKAPMARANADMASPLQAD